jgi:hypothetical protein
VAAAHAAGRGHPREPRQLYAYAREEDRDPDDVGVHGRIALDTDDTDELVDRVEAWQDLDADYLAIDAMREGRGPEEYVEAIETFAEAMADAGIELVGEG